MLSVNILKLGLAFTLATAVFFFSIIFAAKLGYTSSSVVMPVCFIVSALVLIGLFIAMKDFPYPKTLSVKVLYSLGGILLLAASITWLYIFV